ncbi:MAG: HDIG domain-containing metalloprotein [Sphaerochaetaceae bacterium]|jgi:putative nucleotidyltransferase with HDIG domain
MTRSEALKLYKQYNSSENLLRHSLSVEAVMRRFAQELGYDEDFWGNVGLLHDIDYELYPDEHLQKAPQMLKDANVDEQTIRAVLSHGWTIVSDVEPIHPMEKVLFTIDELTGLINATALMRPSKSLDDLTVSSVKKKFKTKGFSAQVDRSIITKGTEMLNLSLDRVIELAIEGMRSIGSELGFLSLDQ